MIQYYWNADLPVPEQCVPNPWTHGLIFCQSSKYKTRVTRWIQNAEVISEI
jgi:hypothetical protein